MGGLWVQTLQVWVCAERLGRGGLVGGEPTALLELVVGYTVWSLAITHAVGCWWFCGHGGGVCAKAACCCWFCCFVLVFVAQSSCYSIILVFEMLVKGGGGGGTGL